MKLSIVIVNYKVELYLRQCLLSVFSSRGVDFEVFVVDNNSADGSCEMVRRHFPQVKLIENDVNVGFSGANNQALEMMQGEYALLLNPDTVVAEDTLAEVCRFMDEHPDAGGLGVKMIDGFGNFLPESKRGFPSPFASFCKIFGLSGLFPNSRRLGKYHLRYLDENQTHEVDILAGAFMLMRMKTLRKTGFLDDTFFMYGEDIDMSYRLTLAGYKNYYFPTQIIHYKGESTQKDSLKYVKMFYESMAIFFKKHFHKSSFLFAAAIKSAIFLKAGTAATGRLIKAIVPLRKKMLRPRVVASLGQFDELNAVFGNTVSVIDESVLYNMPLLIALLGQCGAELLVVSAQTASYREIIDLHAGICATGCAVAIYHPDEKMLVASQGSWRVRG